MIEADTRVWEAPEEDITTIFRKDPELWTADNRARVVAHYREYMAHLRELALGPFADDPKWAIHRRSPMAEPKKKPVRRKAKVDPRQNDLFGEETS
jgi:hypothetical protein